MNKVFYSILAYITVCFMLINPQDISKKVCTISHHSKTVQESSNQNFILQNDIRQWLYDLASQSKNPATNIVTAAVYHIFYDSVKE